MGMKKVWVVFISSLVADNGVEFPVGYRVRVDMRLAELWARFDFVKVKK